MAKHEGNWGVFKVIALLVVAGIAFAAWMAFGENILAFFKHRELIGIYAEHQKSLFEKAQAVVGKAGGQKNAPKVGSRAGKAVWIRVRLRPLRNRVEWDLAIDEDMARLPAELRADKPEEVRTVVLVYPKAGRVGKYVPKGGSGPTLDAFAQSLDLHVVDLEKESFTACTHFEWDPRQTIELGESHIQERDHEKTVGWYTALAENP